MKEYNFFIKLTKNGIVYNRTNGCNSRVVFGQKYPVLDHNLLFESENNNIIITRFDKNMKMIYKEFINQPGSYLISRLFILKRPNELGLIRNFRKKLSDYAGNIHFKVVIGNDLKSNFDVKLQAVLNKVYIYTLIIKVNGTNFNGEAEHKINSIVKQLCKGDFKSFSKYLYDANKTNCVFDLNEDFFEEYGRLLNIS